MMIIIDYDHYTVDDGAALIRSLPLNYKIPGSIPCSAEIWIFVSSSLPAKLIQLSIFSSVCLKLTYDSLVSRSGRVKRSHPFHNITEIRIKRWPHKTLSVL